MSRSFVSASSQVLSSTTVPVTVVPFSWCCWFRPTGTLANQELLWLGNGAASNNYWTLGIDSTGVIRNSARNTTEHPALTTVGPSANIWQHAGGTFTSATSRAAYLNGGNKGTQTTSTTPNTTTRFSVGCLHRSVPSNFFDGQIAHVALWNVALTDGEMAALGAGLSPLGVRPQSLKRYAPYLGRDSSDLDIIGRAAFTVTGATLSSEEPPLLWLPARRKIFLPSGAAGATFAADSASVATLTGALSTAITCAGALACSATLTAALSTAIRFAAAPADVVTLGASLSTAIRMAAAPAGVVTLSGALSTAIPLAAAPVNVVTLTADLSAGSGAALASALSASATLTAALSTQITLAAAAAAVVTLTAELGATGKLRVFGSVIVKGQK